jgi:hypothetical protein
VIRTCSECQAWAQWVLLWIERPPEEEETTSYTNENGEKVTKTLVPRGLKLIQGPFLCGKHKQAMEKISSEAERTFRFIGATPLKA